MSYEIELTQEAENDIEKHKKSGDRNTTKQLLGQGE
jgi:hypothetical protein